MIEKTTGGKKKKSITNSVFSMNKSSASLVTLCVCNTGQK